MKKRIFCLMIAIFMLAGLASCCSEPEESSLPAPEIQKITVPVINGVKLSDFTVVYKNNSNEIQKYKYVADAFVKYVKTNYGVSLKCVPHNAKQTDNEIIFGVVSDRDISKGKTKNYGVGGYTVAVKGAKVLVASSWPSGCYGGMEALCQKFNSAKKGIIDDMEFSGEKKVIKVACVGDSITYGANSDDPINATYPAFLQNMLGYDYYVLNAGISGYSVCKTDEYAYRKSVEYSQAQVFKPDVVLFALGINDANPTPTQPYKNWDDPTIGRESLFRTSANELLDSFIKINPDVQIIMLMPTKLFKVGEDSWNAEAWNENLKKHVIPLLQEIAMDRSLRTIEFFNWSEAHKDIFTDGLHPGTQGYKSYARHVYDEIKDAIKKP